MTVSRVSENVPTKWVPPHKLVVTQARQMRKVLAAVVKTWNVRASVTEVIEEIPRQAAPLPPGLLVINEDGQVSQPGQPYQYMEQVFGTRPRHPDEYPQAEPAHWDDLYRAAVYLRDQADRLARYAQQEGRRTREHDHIHGVIR